MYDVLFKLVRNLPQAAPVLGSRQTTKIQPTVHALCMGAVPKPLQQARSEFLLTKSERGGLDHFAHRLGQCLNISVEQPVTGIVLFPILAHMMGRFLQTPEPYFYRLAEVPLAVSQIIIIIHLNLSSLVYCCIVLESMNLFGLPAQNWADETPFIILGRLTYTQAAFTPLDQAWASFHFDFRNTTRNREKARS